MLDCERFLSETFGIPDEIIKQFKFIRRGKSIWAYSGKMIETEWESLGIRALRIDKRIKPTTDFLRLVGRYATKNVVKIDEDLLSELILKGEVSMQLECYGYVIIKCDDFIVGCGYSTGKKLISMIPKRYRFLDDTTKNSGRGGI